MQTKEFQKKCADIVAKIDRDYDIKRDAQLLFVQLIEEIGELARDINSKKVRKKNPDKENMAGEFADVFMLFSRLAQMHNVDIEKAVKNKIKILKKRGYIK